MAITTKKNIEIRYGETDQMGVVYHSQWSWSSPSDDAAAPA